MFNPHGKFHKDYQFCPKCKSDVKKNDNFVECKNKQCDFSGYNNPAACVSVAVTYNNKILLSVRGIEPDKGKWDVPGGFVDTEESAEQCVVREIKEETNLDVIETIYLGSTPDVYGEKPSLALIYLAKIKPGEPVPMDDVVELKWFELDKVPDKSEYAFDNNVEQTIKKARKYLIKEK